MSLKTFLHAVLVSVNLGHNPVSLTLIADGETVTLPFASGFFEDDMEDIGEHMSEKLRPGDEIRYSRYDSVYGGEPSIAYVLNPRPTIDQVTLDYLVRAGVDMDEVAREAADVCWLWSHDDDFSEFEVAIGTGQGEGRNASSEGIALQNVCGTIMLDEMLYGDDKGLPCLELRGNSMYVCSNENSPPLPEGSIAGRRIGDLVPLPYPGCFLSGDEVIEAVDGSLVRLVSSQVPLPSPEGEPQRLAA